MDKFNAVMSGDGIKVVLFGLVGIAVYISVESILLYTHSFWEAVSCLLMLIVCVAMIYLLMEPSPQDQD